MVNMHQYEAGKYSGEKILMELDQVEQNAKLYVDEFIDGGALTSPSYLVRTRTLGPPLENHPETPPSSRR